nr:uncharacterized protein LOC110356497 isoform X2 [Columba livia]
MAPGQVGKELLAELNQVLSSYETFLQANVLEFLVGLGSVWRQKASCTCRHTHSKSSSPTFPVVISALCCLSFSSRICPGSSSFLRQLLPAFPAALRAVDKVVNHSHINTSCHHCPDITLRGMS